MDALYFPIFRSRQQEFLVLKSFDFGPKIVPIIEVIKEKDRINNAKTSAEIFTDLINEINAGNVLLDLPTYLRPTTSTMKEAIKFYRMVISDLSARISFYSEFESIADKTIPVISSLLNITGETRTVFTQSEDLKPKFPTLAYRIYFNHFKETINEFSSDIIRDDDIILFDLDSIPITNPIITKYSNMLHTSFPNNNCALIRSAIGTDISNIKLVHDDVIGEADNSLLSFYKRNYKFNSFGDYVGIKKDELPAGGGISPGFVFYDPIDNIFYGYKGDIKKLSEFEDRIVPDLFASSVYRNLESNEINFLSDNPGIMTLKRIENNEESGKSQAKFKKISMEHYLHCMKVMIEKGSIN